MTNIAGADVKIGVHPNNHSLFVLRRTGILEGILQEHGAAVAWVDYEDGAGTPQKLAAGEIDFGGTGATPPLTGQASGIDLVYVAISEPRPASGALVVRTDSPVNSIADLKGRRVALAEGSWQTSFLITALDQHGLAYKDIERINLSRGGDDALVAGEVEAWIGNDPQLAALQRDGAVRTLLPVAPFISHRSVWFASRDFATNRPEILDAVVSALQRSDAWVREHHREAAEIFARDLPDWPSIDAWEDALRRRPWGLHPVSQDFVSEQQRVADLFARQGLLSRPITVADAVLAPTAALRRATA
ncbi:aliphatic sulfonate ABC transporter substrate-binding protein [Paenibacillus naphthalenovorans]|uniref:aliphatic sulfonate ABC transporter substrate-binding protein n=1 Tax=Paenibacillus naphthalenovorans TaxID=162209 RepID=UPI0010B04435|nr:aliphatic sulfonate ABC transporter substrate-binding protein [Paenibacillus naphthalenovorans]GCL71831.1 aliphatic sulfonate ABC transporter substrate-binding protein [Paenibacillus naphthalenovorans]